MPILFIFLIWFCSVLLIQSRGGSIENTASSTVIFTAPLHSNGTYPSFACVFVAVGMCLPSRYLAMGLRVTIFWHCVAWKVSLFSGWPPTRLHEAITKKSKIKIFSALKTSNLVEIYSPKASSLWLDIWEDTSCCIRNCRHKSIRCSVTVHHCISFGASGRVHFHNKPIEATPL
jgi:hypothetical protein